MRGGEPLAWIRSRRSVRRFRDEPLDESTERLLVEAASWAPSAGNAQPWRFVLVRDRATRLALESAAARQKLIGEAALLVVVCADLERARRAYGDRGVSLYCLQDTAAATQNMLLAAHAVGLGTCWVGAFDERRVAQLLSLSPSFRPVAIVAVGHPAEQPRAPRRRPFGEIAQESAPPPVGSR